MVIEYKPRPLTRKELASFLPNMRAIKAFERLFDVIPEDIINIISTISSVEQYLISNIEEYNSNYTTTDDDDTILINCSSNPVTISLGLGLLDGKRHNFVCIDDTYDCIIDGNGSNINTEATFQLYKHESLAVQKINTDWWVI